MLIYAAFNMHIDSCSHLFTLIFVDPSETEIIKDSVPLLRIEFVSSRSSVCSVSCVTPFRGSGLYSPFVFSGVAEMDANPRRVLVVLLISSSAYASVIHWLGFLPISFCPAYIYVYRRLIKMKRK